MDRRLGVAPQTQADLKHIERALLRGPAFGSSLLVQDQVLVQDQILIQDQVLVQDQRFVEYQSFVQNECLIQDQRLVEDEVLVQDQILAQPLLDLSQRFRLDLQKHGVDA